MLHINPCRFGIGVLDMLVFLLLKDLFVLICTRYFLVFFFLPLEFLQLQTCVSLQFKKFHHGMPDGWGLATDGKLLFGSDGSSTLYHIDPQTMKGFVI